jgi:hypothetical protein
VTTAGASQRRTDSDPQEHASAGTAAAPRSASSRNYPVTTTNEGDTPVNRILSSAVKVAGSLAVVGGALAAAATPAGAINPIRAYGVAAQGFINIPQVAVATNNFTPATASSFVFPDFVTTGGILDRATATSAFANVGSPKIYVDGNITDQLNADNAQSSCRLLFGIPFGSSTIQNGSIMESGLPNIALPRNPAPNTKIFIPGVTITLNKQVLTAGVLTVTAIYASGGGQNLSIGVSRC